MPLIIPSTTRLDMIPVSEAIEANVGNNRRINNSKILSSMSVALSFCCLINFGSPPRVALFGGKHAMLRIQLLSSAVALFVRIELLCSSVRRLPQNRANRVAVFEGNPIRYNNVLRDEILLCLAVHGQYYNCKTVRVL